MASRLEPANDYVMVVDSDRTTIIGDISLPDNVKQLEMFFGVVVAIGPHVTKNTNLEDRVCYGPYAGKTVVVGGFEFRILKEAQIEGYVREGKTGNERPVGSDAAGEA
jgi:co-chaperonin GroES (HSP10)